MTTPKTQDLDQSHFTETQPASSRLSLNTKRTSRKSNLLQPVNSLSSRRFRTSFSHISTFTHSSLASELDSPSVYSCDSPKTARTTTNLRQSSPRPHNDRQLMDKHPPEQTHTREDSLVLSDPTFVQAIDEMSGRTFRLSLMRFSRQLELPRYNALNRTEEHPDTDDAVGKRAVGLTGPAEQPIRVDFASRDRKQPPSSTRTTKWMITFVACLFTLLTSCAEMSYTLGFPSMIQDLDCTSFQAQVGASIFALSYGLTPLLTAPLSEFGRIPLYIGSGLGFSLTCIMIALAKNIQTVIVGRFLQGMFASTGAAIVVGSITDIWSPEERLLPMALFSVVALGGLGLGPAVAGWLGMNPRLEWRWIQWIQIMILGLFFVLLVFIVSQTHSKSPSNQDTGVDTEDSRYHSIGSETAKDSAVRGWGLCTRAFKLIGDPLVLVFSVWLALTWCIASCVIQSILPVFGSIRGFTKGHVGLPFLSILIGTGIGFICHFYQNHLYKKHHSQNGPGAHLYSTCGAVFLLPTGVFIYAWTTPSLVHWIVPVIGIVLLFAAIFVIFLAIVSYLAECCGSITSSAFAVLWLARNLSAIAFPLFSKQMFQALGYAWANTLFGGVAIVMIPFPFALLSYDLLSRHGRYFL